MTKTILNVKQIGVAAIVCVLFCHPFGAGYVIAFTRGFTPGYKPFSPSGLL